MYLVSYRIICIVQQTEAQFISDTHVRDEAWRKLLSQHGIPVDVCHVVQILQLCQAGNALLDIYAQQLGEKDGFKHRRAQRLESR